MKSILFIDDHGPVARLPRSILGRAGYLVFTVGSAGEALVFAARSAPDLMVVGSPVEGPAGESLLQTLRSVASLRTTPVLALVEPDEARARTGGPGTAGSREPSWKTSFNEGKEGPALDGQPDEIVQIPANPYELLAKVRYLLDEDTRRPPPRLSLKRAAEVEDGEIQAIGFLLNLSGSGALVETQAAGALTGPVRLRFRLPVTDHVLETVGRVIRRDESEGGTGRVAVEFVEMDPESQRTLEKFLFLKG